MTGLRLRQAAEGDLLALPLALLAGLAAVRLVLRDPARREAPPGWRALAWGSALLPLAAQPGGEAALPPAATTALTLAGLAVAIWALAALGRSFGIAPADRGLVVRGPYRRLRHPAYLGELVAVAGYVLGHLSLRNLAVLGGLLAALVLRIRQEERLIAGYQGYAARVRWRLVPGVW